MSTHDVVSLEQLRELATEQEHSVSIYLRTDPREPDEARTGLKSALDQAIRELREAGLSNAQEEGLREQLSAVENSGRWGELSGSIALFLTPTSHRFFVLVNALESSTTAGRWFELGPLLRAATAPQEALALTLSQEGWQLWHATAAARAAEVQTDPDHPQDIADATNRATVRDRGHVRRLVGDEGRTVLLEKYAKRVAEAVVTEADALDAERTVPLVIFSASPLLELAVAEDYGRPVRSVSGAADELTDHEIDAALRGVLDELNAERAAALAEEYMDGDTAGRVSTDAAELGRAAVAGAVDTLLFDFTATLTGELDDVTGEIEFLDNGHDLLAQLALAVVERDGTVLAVRPGEAGSFRDGSPILARLRHALV